MQIKTRSEVPFQGNIPATTFQLLYPDQSAQLSFARYNNTLQYYFKVFSISGPISLPHL